MARTRESGLPAAPARSLPPSLVRSRVRTRPGDRQQGGREPREARWIFRLQRVSPKNNISPYSLPSLSP